MSNPHGDKNTRTRTTEAPVTVTPERARQGLLGRPVLVVLVAGITLALVAWGLAEIYGEAIDPQSTEPAQQTAPSGGNTPQEDQPVVDNSTAGERQQPAPTDKDPTPQSGTGGESQTVSPTGLEKQ